MKLQTKKIIAREFLVLAIAIGVAVISYLVIYSYNYLEQNTTDKLSQKIVLNNTISNKLSSPYTEKFNKQLWFANKYYKQFQNDKAKTTQFYNKNGIPIIGKDWNFRVFDRLMYLSHKDSLITMWNGKNFYEEFGKYFNINTAEDFKIFVDENLISQDDINKKEQSEIIYNKTRPLQIKRDILKSKINSSIEQFNIVSYIFLAFLIIAFILRYIFYGIKWSIKTLKVK